MAEEFTSTVATWAPMIGVWETGEDSIIYIGPSKFGVSFATEPVPYGIILGGARFDSGRVRTTINLSPDAEAGRILLGFDARDSRYVTAGIGGNGEAYIIEEFDPDHGIRRLAGAGSMENLATDHFYPVEVRLDGQRVSLRVDNIKVLEHILREPLGREQVGLFTKGVNPVKFGPVEISTQSLSAFVVIQFTPSSMHSMRRSLNQFAPSWEYRPTVLLTSTVLALSFKTSHRD